MKRYTKRNRESDAVQDILLSSVSRINAYKKLAEYEDAEEDGRLVWLPCKVGDEVFVIEGYTDNNQKYYAIGTWNVFEIQINRNGTIMFHLGHQGVSDYGCVYLSEIGDKWTTTCEAAEKRLEGLKQENKNY